MKESRKKGWEYPAVIFAVISSYLAARLLQLYYNSDRMNSLQLSVLFFLAIGAIVVIRYMLSGQRTDKEDKEDKENGQVVTLIILMGLALRILYMLYTSCEVRSHDLWELSTDSYGHAAYILNIMQLKQLPQSNMVQFYQQPLFYLCGAALSGIVNGLLQCSETYHLVDATKVVSCIASCISLLVSREIFGECHLTGKGLCRGMMVVSFLPVYFLTGGRVCPDALAGMFMLLAFLYTIRWSRVQSWKNTIVLALIYGLGVMTKISCSALALVTVLVFLKFLWNAIQSEKRGMVRKNMDRKNMAGLLLRYIVFGCISLPLGLWYGIRNYIRFDQPLLYVVELTEDNSLYTGNISLFRRIVTIDWRNLLQSPYTAVREDYNLPVYALKSSLFGEFQYDVPEWTPKALLFFASLLSVFCVIALIRYATGYFKGKEKGQSCNLALLAAAIFYGSILSFYIRYPFGCSMDFRYMLFLPVPIAAILGKTEWKSDTTGLYLDFSCIGFMVFSCLMFC